MPSKPVNRSWIIWLTLLIGLVIQNLPWGMLTPYKPNILLLFLIYWLLALPHRVSFLTSLVIGLLLDLSAGSVLGMHIFALAIVTYLVQFKFQLFRNLALWQQALIIFLLMLIYEMILFVLAIIINYAVEWSHILFINCLINALLWPWVFLLLRKIRRVFWIQ